eukprot:6640263-Pyramimonas_sp.AAC.1
MLMGYLVDPTLGDHFMSITQRLSFSEAVEREEEWCSRKQLLDKYDESEAEEMIAEQKIMARLLPLVLFLLLLLFLLFSLVLFLLLLVLLLLSPSCPSSSTT